MRQIVAGRGIPPHGQAGRERFLRFQGRRYRPAVSVRGLFVASEVVKQFDFPAAWVTGFAPSDRVGLTGLRPSALPHHRTCGFPHPAVGPGHRLRGGEV